MNNNSLSRKRVIHCWRLVLNLSIKPKSEIETLVDWKGVGEKVISKEELTSLVTGSPDRWFLFMTGDRDPVIAIEVDKVSSTNTTNKSLN